MARDAALLDVWSGMEKFLSILPRPHATAVIRVTGHRSANRTRLAQIAVATALDRLSPLLLGVLIGYLFRSVQLIQNVSTEAPPTMEVHVDLLLTELDMLENIVNPGNNLAASQNTANFVKDGTGVNIMKDDIKAGNPPFPGNQYNQAGENVASRQNVGSRGWWVGMAVTQIFQDPIGQCSGVPVIPTPEFSEVQADVYDDVSGPENPTNITLD